MRFIALFGSGWRIYTQDVRALYVGTLAPAFPTQLSPCLTDA